MGRPARKANFIKTRFHRQFATLCIDLCDMAKRKAALQNGQAGQKKQKKGLAEQLPVQTAIKLVTDTAPVAAEVAGAASGKAERKGKAKRLGKAARLQAAAMQAAEAPLPESALAAAQSSERSDGSGAAAAAVGPAVNGTAAAREAAFRNKEKVLLLSSRGITHRCEGLFLALLGTTELGSRAGALIFMVLQRATNNSHRKHLLSRFRHLLLDLAQLLPHSKKDSKLDTKSDRGILNEVADMKVWAPGFTLVTCSCGLTAPTVCA